VINNHPSGTNINANCGSTHPEQIQQLVKNCKANIGITHDGDADRVLLADEHGELVDGDEIMAIAATDYLQRGCLEGGALVSTIMSNFGLDETLESLGGRVIRTKVGDRHVIEAMLRDGHNVGGEQSGHMIFRDYATTGDGIVSALQILRVMIETGKPLSELKKVLKKYPQAQRNLKVREKPALETLSGVQSLLAEAETALDGKGRVLLRYSGTEPKIRLLIEGREQDIIDQHADKIAAAIQEKIGI
jgi:phosphoglucosamine mutase